MSDFTMILSANIFLRRPDMMKNFINFTPPLENYTSKYFSYFLLTNLQLLHVIHNILGDSLKSEVIKGIENFHEKSLVE